MPQQVAPAILENTLEEIKKRVEEVRPYIDTIHLDIMDGQFVPNITFNDPAKLAENKLGVKIRPHLMVSNPEFCIKKWDIEEVETIIFHREAANNVEEVIRLIKNINKKVGIAVNPRTSSYEIKDYLNDIDLVLVMGVEPGFSAQAFNADVLEKISYLKKLKPGLPIAVDGGVSDRTKDKIVAAGADVLNANSFIFKSPNIKAAIEYLKN